MLLLLMLTLLLRLPLLMLPLLSASCFLLLRRTAGLRRGFTVAVVAAAVAAVVVAAADIGVVTAAVCVGVVKVMFAAIGVGCRVTLPIVCVCGPKLKLIVGAGV